MGFSIAKEVKKLFKAICCECWQASGRISRIGARIWLNDHTCARHQGLAAQQETGSRSKRHPKSVEGLRVKGEGER